MSIGSRRRASLLGVLVLVAATALFGTGSPVGAAGGDANTVLILGSTVTGGASSREATYLASKGFTVEVADDATWAAKTADEFGSYRAIILGDPTCGGIAPAAAEANAMTWGPQVDGEIIVIGTDPIFHYGTGQAQQLIEQGLDFAVSDATHTGLYATLSCYNDSDAPNTPVPMLAGIDGGNFQVQGTSCDDDVHITATHPALTGLTDAGLTGWGCSTHESFDAFPVTFSPLAMAIQEDGVYVAPDGTRGEVYIIARGVEVFRALTLTPETAENPVGTSHTVTANFTLNSSVVSGQEVVFTVTEGPHAGTTGTGVTDASGNASFTYTGTSAGTDTIIARATVVGATTFESNTVTKTWVAPPETTSTTAGTTTSTATRSATATPTFTG